MKFVTERQILHDSIYVLYLKQSDSGNQRVEWWLPGSGGEGRMGSYLMETEFQFGKMKKFLGTDDDDGCMRMWRYQCR